jgi:hypothetical protein
MGALGRTTDWTVVSRRLYTVARIGRDGFTGERPAKSAALQSNDRQTPRRPAGPPQYTGQGGDRRFEQRGGGGKMVNGVDASGFLISGASPQIGRPRHPFALGA